MASASRTDERRAALWICLVIFGWLACIFGWASILSFDVTQSPSTSVWPHSAEDSNLCGPLGAWMAWHAHRVIGLGVYPLLLLCSAAVCAWSQRRTLHDLWLRGVGLVLILTACSAGATLLLEPSAHYPVTGPGGVVGTAAVGLLVPNLQTFGTWLMLSLGLAVGILLAADDLLVATFRWLRWAGEHSAPVLSKGGAAVAGAGAAAGAAVASGVSTISGRLAHDETDEPARSTRPPRQLEFESPAEGPDDTGEEDDEEKYDEKEEYEYEEDENEDEEEDEPEPEQIIAQGESDERAPLPLVRDVAPRRTPPAKPAPRRNPRFSHDDYELPPVNLLESPIALDRSAIETLCREKAYVLEQTLNEFRLEVQVVAIETGPVITVFELKLAPGIKVSQIVSLNNDMARALKAPAVRVVAPLPGKSTIGIEVPNLDKEKVRLRDVMEMAGSRADNLAIPLFLGKDASGQPLVADLARMPHLLIAGTTGSGKSVCIGSIIMSLLLTRSPAEVQTILVDPKVVELAMYKDVPHLMCPIVTEMSRAESILDWASTKMDERYALFAEAGVKDIRSYNRLGEAGLRERLEISDDEELDKIPVRLPYIVIVVDELADLMMTAAKEVEFYLCRIAQKSRAVGIHLIVATQRPQANVVTGLIKSNMPCRIAFRVASRLDSRIVLDQNGGEVLMGQGDMLFLPPGQSKLVRAQGTFVSDDELRAVVRHCREQHAQEFHPELTRLPSTAGGGGADRDEFFDDAVDIIIQTKRGSVSLLQRRFNIGYGRASRLVDQMFEAGIVGEYKGSQAREVLVTQEEWEEIKRQRDREESVEESELLAE